MNSAEFRSAIKAPEPIQPKGGSGTHRPQSRSRASRFRPYLDYAIAARSRISFPPLNRHAAVVISTALFQPMLANWLGFVCLFGLFIFVKFLSSPSFKGRFGEWMVNRGLRGLDRTHYHHFHDLYLPHPSAAGTTQIDHVVVSPFGIFVIETKNYRGWIFGSEKQRQWTQQIYRSKTRFDNPLHQNKLHVSALMQLLEMPEDRFLPVVVFIGNSELKTAMPDNVLNRGLMAWIKRHSEIRLDAASTTKAVARLDQLHRSTDRRSAAREHLAALRARHAHAHY